MSPIGPNNGRYRRGATRRRPPPRQQRAGFDRWLDHAVDVAVITALMVGGVALVLNLLL
ncbi:hypothetical protein [Halomonas sp. DQ26W]|uniref:hypothetical protein n=1 Tax=Halomonas sp. DQ26W TaxID=2282311 RepID=UPI0015F11AE5|nr:hypothetical protein [Halomonas sp. DQ26W]